MANLFVRSSDGNNSDNGSTWALAKATVTGALAAAAAGDTIFVSDNHDEASAGVSLTSPGTAASPVKILCVDDAGDPSSPTTLATTAKVKSSGHTAMVLGTGYTYVYGVTFWEGYDSGFYSSSIYLAYGATPCWWCLDNCVIRQSGTYTAAPFIIGNPDHSYGHRLELVNSTIRLALVEHNMILDGDLLWDGGSIDVTDAAPTVLFTIPHNAGGGIARIRGVDLSGLASGKSLVSVAGAKNMRVSFENCKLGAAVSLTTGTNPGQASGIVTLDNCDSGDTNYRMQRHRAVGDVYNEQTVIHTGGANDGTTAFGWKMVSSALAKVFAPLVSPEIAVWNDAVGGALTLTAEILHDSVTALTDAEAWVEVQYAGTSGSTKSSFLSDRAANVLATPANQTVSTETWTTTGITNVNKQKLAVTFTPQEKGYVNARVMIGKASYTVYVDPKVAVA